MHIRKPIFEDYFLTRVETSFFYVKFVFVKKINNNTFVVKMWFGRKIN